MTVSFAEAAHNNARQGLGDEFKSEIDAALHRIEVWPHASSKASKEARICAAKRFPYGVVYVPEDDRIVVVAIMHLRRRPGYWKKRLKDLGP